MLIISRQDVEDLLPVSEAIPCVARAYAELSAGTANVPDRIGLKTEDGVTLIMPGHLSGEDSLAVKIVSVFPGNRSEGKPSIYGIVNVFDPTDGRPLALIEGAYLTALRTGASVGLATKLLSREDSSTMAMIGLGAQSRTIVPAVCAVRDIKEVYAFDTDAAAFDRFSKDLGESFPIESVRSADEAVGSSDIVCTATTSNEPVFDGAGLTAGTHINGIGSFTPEMREVGFEALKRCSKIVVDSLSGAMSEAGDLIRAIEAGVIGETDIDCEIGEIVLGKCVGRETNEAITFFKSVGNAGLDIAVGNEIYRRAKENSVGAEVSLD
ncbi:MAG: ornithine cyclodeaminase [Acidobacteriota bacterium]|nr:MAG: ornithine cyclodeaminase [Acidobacteriota bacterium]